jgi:hypothetical protein
MLDLLSPEIVQRGYQLLLTIPSTNLLTLTPTNEHIQFLSCKKEGY